MKDAELPDPVFQKIGIFTVILKRPVNTLANTSDNTDLNALLVNTLKTNAKKDQKILTLLESNNSLTAENLAEKLMVSFSSYVVLLALSKTLYIFSIAGVIAFAAAINKHCSDSCPKNF